MFSKHSATKDNSEYIKRCSNASDKKTNNLIKNRPMLSVDTILIIFLLSLIKYFDKANLREKGLLWLTVHCMSSWERGSHCRGEVKAASAWNSWLPRIHSQEENNECFLVFSSGSLFYTPQAPPRGNDPTHCQESLPHQLTQSAPTGMLRGQSPGLF